MAADDANRIRLGTRNGLDYWLDLNTGKEISAPSPPLPSLIAVAAQAFSDREYQFAQPAADRLESYLTDPQGNRLRLTICADQEAGNVMVFFRALCMVPRRRRSQAAEYLTRANWGMAIGSFDMDWNDGEVLFRASLSAPTHGVTAEIVGRLIDAAFWSMRRYGEGLERTVVGENPEAVIFQIESQP